MDNIILIFILLTLIGGSALYIYRAKRRGQTCIGCPHAKQCQRAKTACACGQEETACSCHQ